MNFFSQLLGKGLKNNDIKDYLDKGAKIIDVRSVGEFRSGNVPGSENIPLDTLDQNINKIKAYKRPLVLCCASGGRSGMAQKLLSNQGIDCINGGSWGAVKNAL